MKSKVANRKRKELRKLTWLLCTFPDSAECPFLHGGRRDSWLPRENTRECDPAGAWKTRRQHASRWLQDGPEEMNHCPKVGTGQFTLSWRVANVTGLRCSAGSHQSAPPICLTWTGMGGARRSAPEHINSLPLALVIPIMIRNETTPHWQPHIWEQIQFLCCLRTG